MTPDAGLCFGKWTMNSVNSPGSVSTSIFPPWLRIMSIDRESPRPVPRFVGLVVKNGLKIFSTTSGGMPVPLSRKRTSIISSMLRVEMLRPGDVAAGVCSILFHKGITLVLRCVPCVGDKV